MRWLKCRLISSSLPFWTLSPRFSWAWRQHCWWTLRRSAGLRCSYGGSARCLRLPPTSLWRWCERWCWGGGLSLTLPTETPGTKYSHHHNRHYKLMVKVSLNYFMGNLYVERMMLTFVQFPQNIFSVVFSKDSTCCLTEK